MINISSRANTIARILHKDDARTEGMKFLFQPIVNSATNSEWGSEILTRWYHPETGSIPPEKLIKLIGSARMDCVFLEMQLARILEESHKARRPGSQDLFFATINLSKRFIENDKIINSLIESSQKMHPKNIKITVELYEGNSYQTLKSTRNIFELQKNGIIIALDDFGVKSSNLNSLINTPVNIVKIDKSIVQKINTAPISKKILDALFCICSEFNVDIIAEGIENSSQYEILKNIGFRLFQGHYFSPPRPSMF